MATSSKTANAADNTTTAPELPSSAPDYSHLSRELLIEFRDGLTAVRDVMVARVHEVGGVLASVETELAIRPKDA